MAIAVATKLTALTIRMPSREAFWPMPRVMKIWGAAHGNCVSQDGSRSLFDTCRTQDAFAVRLLHMSAPLLQGSPVVCHVTPLGVGAW